jgi:predicted esterase
MPLSDNLGFVHRFVPPPDDRLRPVTLLLLGTGGDENDLLQHSWVGFEGIDFITGQLRATTLVRLRKAEEQRRLDIEFLELPGEYGTCAGSY